MTPSVRTKSVVFYLVAALSLILIVVQGMSDILPSIVQWPIERSGESAMLALLICAYIQFVRPRLASGAQGWRTATAIGFGCLVVALILRDGRMPSALGTLNEPWVAMFPLVLYFQIRRPLRWPLAYSFVVLAGTIALFNHGLVSDQAESIVAIMLAPIAFDVADPTILERRSADRPIARGIWCIVLAVSWTLLTVFVRDPREGLSGFVDRGFDYALRSDETILGLLIVHVYFSYVLGRAWREGARNDRADHSDSPTSLRSS